MNSSSKCLKYRSVACPTDKQVRNFQRKDLISLAFKKLEEGVIHMELDIRDYKETLFKDVYKIIKRDQDQKYKSKDSLQLEYIKCLELQNYKLELSIIKLKQKQLLDDFCNQLTINKIKETNHKMKQLAVNVKSSCNFRK